MNNEVTKIELEEGKYTVFIGPDGNCNAFRYNEYWEAGARLNNLECAMAYKIVELEKEVERQKKLRDGSIEMLKRNY